MTTFSAPPSLPKHDGVNARVTTPHITLVGAGPGDPELLTLKAVEAIRQAQVLLVDDLVHADVLKHASAQARVVHVGKRGGCKSTPQAFIQKLMVQEAMTHQHVVRLKGGDPFIFGRGGEEVQYLQAHGIGVTVINGITAGLAAVTSLHVPLTHRDHAHGVVFITGHQAAHEKDPVDWPQLAATAAQCKLTLVIYMGMTSAALLQQQLLKGMPRQTPVALIQQASLPAQRHAICTLDQLQATIETEQLASPCVIVIGDVLQGLAHWQQQASQQHSA